MVVLTKTLSKIDELKGAINHLEFRKAVLNEELRTLSRRPKWFFPLIRRAPKYQVIGAIRFQLSNMETDLKKLRIELFQLLKANPKP